MCVCVCCVSAPAHPRLCSPLQEYLKNTLPLVRETTVSVHSLDEQDVVLGSAWDFPRGGLFKFIDDITNPCSTFRESEDEYGAIYASLNEVGQYTVRELLEGHQSQTHRQTIRKTHIVFVLRISPDSKVTSTILSRSHLVVHCT